MSGVLQSFRLNGNDESGNPRDTLAADNIYRISLLLSIILTVLFVTEVVVISVFPSGMGDLNKFTWDIAPNFSKAITILAVCFGILANPFGTVGFLMQSRKLVLIHFFLSCIAIFVNLGVFVFLLMSGNGVVATGRDVNSNDLDDKSVNINTFSDDTQEKIVRFALDEEDIWLSFQDDANQCCGFNLQAIYADVQFGIEDFDLEDISTGVQCGIFLDDMAEFKEEFPLFNDTTIEAAEDVEPFSTVNFFCERDLAGDVKDKAQTFSVLFGVQAFVQVVLAFLTGLLLYTYEEREGGLKEDEEDFRARATVENTPVMRAGSTVKKSKNKDTPNVRF